MHQAPPDPRTLMNHPWQAHRIWSGDDQLQPNRFYWFRRVVELDQINPVRLFITAESRYRLFINGRYVREGPPPSIPDYQYYDVQNVSRFLQRGLNCIAVLVRFTGHMHGTRGGLQAELLDEHGAALLTTDTTWQATRAVTWADDTAGTWMNSYDPYQEWYDARLEPADWTLPAYACDWPAATLVPPPAGHILPTYRLIRRDIPDMAGELRYPIAITRIEECLAIEDRSRRNDLSIKLSAPGLPLAHAHVAGAEHLLGSAGITRVSNSDQHLHDPNCDSLYDPCLLLDFGKVITGAIELDLEADGGCVIDMGISERLIDGYFNNAIECPFCFRYVTTDGRQQWRSFIWRGFRYLRLRFSHCHQPIRLHAVGVWRSTYPFEYRGEFQSTDPLLNRTFGICRYTIGLCCHESVMDTPWREQAQWLGDVAAVTLPGIYCCFGDSALPAKFLRQSAATRRPDGMLTIITNSRQPPSAPVIPDYALWWCQAIWRHYLYTGDRDILAELYPVAQGIVDGLLGSVDSTGLIVDPPGWLFIDWANVQKDGCSSVLNALFHGTLAAMKTMADELDRPDDAAKFDETSRRIAANFNRAFFDPQRGCYVDVANGDRVSEHANAAAILWNLCDVVTAAQVVEHIWEQPSTACVRAEPFFTSVVLRALDHAGRFDLAMNIIRRRWGKYMVEQGATSTYEEWHLNCSFRDGQSPKALLRAISHAWSAYPATFLTEALIGLTILEPGCRSVRINPKSIGFDYEVSYPTPAGLIQVRMTDNEPTVTLPNGIHRR
ncbi:MAG: family 78 glycoside hydrolase catalytic domain [Phycisphaerales bacterium]